MIGIPENLRDGWNISRLGFVATVKARLGWRGLTASEYVDGGYIFLSTPNIKGREIDFENVNYITAERYLESPEIMLHVGDVLLAKDGSTLGICAPVRHLPSPATVNGSIAVIRPQPELHPVYLYYLLASAPIQSRIQQFKDGMGVPHLFQSDIRKFPIILPPVTEQRSIADFLDRETGKIDELIANKLRLISALTAKREALIRRAVTGASQPHLCPSNYSFIGDVPSHWTVCELRRKWKVIDCKHRTATYVPEGIPIVSTTEVKPGRLDLTVTRQTSREEYLDLISDGRKPKRHDIIYSRNASIGAAAYVDTDEPFCMGQDVCLITSDDQDQLFLTYQLNSRLVLDQVDAMEVGATFKRINVGQIKTCTICVPPVEEQRKIASYLDGETSRIDSLIEANNGQCRRLSQYRSALITAAVTGQIDVRSARAQEAVSCQ